MTGEYSDEAMTSEPPPGPCPAIEELEDYLSDPSDTMPAAATCRNASAGTDRRRAVTEHLSRCATCRESLADIEANLDLVAPLRTAARGAETAMEGDVPERIGPYRIVRELGRGGMGVVYLAERDRPSRRVALKVIRPDITSRHTLRRFEQEANALAQLQHPGIAQVYDAGAAGVRTLGGAQIEQPYLAMQLVDGVRLDDYVAARAPEPAARLELLAQIADAVHHAHLKGVIHRDLKPANILVQGDAPVILDFGVARIVTPDRSVERASWHTNAGKLLGTIPYMSPEQIDGDPARVDARSDVYALGVIAFEALAGELPHVLESPALLEAARIIREEPPRRLGAIDARYRGDVETIVATALEKAPERRYASAAELAADLRRVVRHEPITARPATALYQLAKFARRNRAIVTGSIIAVAALVVGLVLALGQAGIANRARDDAERRLQDALAQGDFLINSVVTRLSMMPEADPLRESIVEDVHAFYVELAPEHPDNVDVQRGLWESLRLLASLSMERGNPTRAAELMRESHALVVRMHDAHPEREDVRFQYGYSLRLLGQYTGGKDEALFDESREILGRLADEHPDDPLHARELASTLQILAGFARARGDLDGAVERCREAVALLERAQPRDDDEVRGATFVASALLHLGNLLYQQKDPARAESTYRRATDVLEALPAERRDDSRTRALLGTILMQRATLAERSGDTPAAVAHVRAALGQLPADDARRAAWEEKLSSLRE